MKPARLELGVDVTMRALYIAVMVCLLWAWLPGVRQAARRWLTDAIYVYRVQRWGEEFARRPAWQREALRVRGRAPTPERRTHWDPPALLERKDAGQ